MASREVLGKEQGESLQAWASSHLPLLPLTLVEEEQAEDASFHLQLLTIPALTTASPVHNAALLRHPASLAPLLLVGEDLGPQESLRVGNKLSFIPCPRLPRTSAEVGAVLGSLVVGLSPSTAQAVVQKSALRRPSVPAITSVATSSERSVASSEHLSLSDSCAHNKNSDSELSYNISEAGVTRPERKTKLLKRKDTFSERFKAAMARGNTPDESDDASGVAAKGKRVLRVNRRVLRRQASSGFRAGDLAAGTESEEFYTAAEDEVSHMERLARRPCLPLTNANGLTRLTSPLLLSSEAPSPPLSASPPTASFSLYSDSSSFSSEGLGMPRLEDGAMEELVERLHGCLEESEGSLEFRALEVRRLTEGRLLRSLSDSYLSCIGDLDRLASLRPGEPLSLREGLGGRATSCGTLGENSGPLLVRPDLAKDLMPVWLEPQGGGVRERQGLALLSWAGATLAGLPGATLSTQVDRNYSWCVFFALMFLVSLFSLFSCIFLTANAERRAVSFTLPE